MMSQNGLTKGKAMDAFEPMWLDRKHIVSSSLCAPSIRTVVLALYHHPDHAAEEQEFDTEVFPVIAIESRIVETYTKRIIDPKGYVDANLPRNILKQMGFRVHSREAEIRPIYAREELLDAHNPRPLLDHFG